MILEAAELKQAHNKYNAINTNCNKKQNNLQNRPEMQVSKSVQSSMTLQ